MRNRFTGKNVDAGVPVFEEDLHFWTPDPRQMVWRYADFWKVESLISQGDVYLRRADKLDDDMEGRYAAVNRTNRIALENRFQEHYEIVSDFDAASASNDYTRSLVFLTCWHMAPHENRFMWDTFTKSRESLAIVSSAGALELALPTAHVFGMNYRDEDEPVPMHHSLAPYAYKRRQFEREQELRVLARGDGENGIFINARDTSFIHRVVTHPWAGKRFVRRVRALCREMIGHAVVEPSCLF